MNDLIQTTRIIRLKEVIKRTALSRSTLYNKLKPGSKQYDPEFPKQVRLGAGAVGWYEDQIEQWLLTRK